MFKRVDRHWINADAESKIKCRANAYGTMSLRDILDYMAENYPNVSMLDVVLVNPMLTWIEDQTEEERARREAFEKQRKDRTEKWERETYIRLKEKYGD